MRVLLKNLFIVIFLLISGTAFSQESSFLLTMGTEVQDHDGFFKVEQFDGKISKFLNTNTQATEREVIIVAPAGQGGMAPPSVERKIRELKAQAKKEGKEIEPRVLLLSKEYLQGVDEELQKYNKAIESSLDPSNNIDVFKDDPTAKDLYDKGDKIGLLNYLSQSGKLDNLEQGEEIKAAAKGLGALKEKLQKTILSSDPEVRRTTAITLPIKVALQSFSCYFAVYIAGGIPPARIIPFIAFNVTMTFLINSFISDFIRYRSVWDTKFTDAFSSLVGRAQAWKSFVNNRIAEHKPWLFDCMISRWMARKLPMALPQTFVSGSRALRYTIKGDFTFQYFVSLFFMVSGITITDSWITTDHFALNKVNSILEFMHSSPDSHLTTLGFAAFILGANLINCLSGVPIDVVNSYLNKVGLFKTTSSIWLSFIPEVLYQKDKLSQVNMIGANNFINAGLWIISVPTSMILRFLYPARGDKNKRKLTYEEIKKTGLDQSILNAKLYPNEIAMLRYLNIPSSDDQSKLYSKVYREEMIRACLDKIEEKHDGLKKVPGTFFDDLNVIGKNIFDPKTPQIPYMEHKTFEDVISEDPEFFVQTFIGLLIEDVKDLSVDEKKVRLSIAETLLDAAENLKIYRYKNKIKELKTSLSKAEIRINSVKLDVLRENVIEYLRVNEVKDVSFQGEATDVLLDKILELASSFDFNSKEGRKVFFGTEEQHGMDGLFYYLQDKLKSNSSSDNSNVTNKYELYWFTFVNKALAEVPDVYSLGAVGSSFIKNVLVSKQSNFFDINSKYANIVMNEEYSEYLLMKKATLEQLSKEIKNKLARYEKDRDIK